jgi:O-antigen ligase
MSVDARNIHQGWISRLTNYSFLLLIFSLGLPQFPIPFFGMEVVATDLLFLLTTGLWVLSLLFERSTFRWHPLYLAIFAYLAALLISAIFSVDRSASFNRFPLQAYLLCLAGLAYNIIDSESLLRRTIVAWLVGTAFAVVLGLATIVLFYLEPNSPLLEYLTYHYGSVPVGDYPRITAGFVSASMLCNYLNVGLVLALLAREKALLPRWMALVLVSAIAIAAVFTISIGLGGLALGAGAWIWFEPDLPRAARRLTFLLGALISFLFLFASFIALASYPGAHAFFTIPLIHLDLMPSARMLVWADAFRTFLSHPLTGVGVGKPVASVVFTNTDGSPSLLTDAHNSFLSVAAQEGIIGLAAFTALVVLILKRWIEKVRNVRSLTIFTAVGLALVCSFVYQGLTGSYEDARHLWVLMGIFMAADGVENAAD